MLPCRRQGRRQVALVQHDDGANAFVLGRHQCTGKQFGAEGRFGGGYQDDLVGIGGDQLLFPRVAAVEQGTARQVVDDERAVVARRLDGDAVAAGAQALLATRHSLPVTAVGGDDLVVSSVGGDDGALNAQRENNMSIFAAQSKSLRLRPPAE